MLKPVIGNVLLLLSLSALSAEVSFKGLLDLRTVYVDSDANSKSYLSGDYGKFRHDDGASLALGQLALQGHVEWENNWSATVVANAFSDSDDIAVGLTEAFFHYKGLPSENGWRFQSKIGVYYPSISIENNATGWSSPYTLTSSAINNWIGEELRNTGVNFKIERLGKRRNSPHTFTAEIDLFQNNDSAGAMLTWHGWTIGSRQTLLHERLVVQDFPARTGMLAEQAAESDPFLELDHRWGFNVKGQWHYNNKLKVAAGYYDNQAARGVVEYGQYTWTTSFAHASFRYKFNRQWELMGQYMSGNTLMTSPTFVDVVDNDFTSAFLMLRKQWAKHHVAFRAEHFEVDDLDETIGDNNNESGKALTLSYRYQLDRKSFVLAETNWIDSSRWSRRYQNQPEDLTEQQFQLAFRHYF